MSHPSLIGRWPDRPLWQTDRQTQTSGRGLGGKERWAEAGAQRQAGREVVEQGPRQGGRWVAPSWKDAQSRLARPSRWGGQLRTTEDGELERQGGPRRQRQRGRFPSSLFPSQQPRVFLSLEPVEPSAPPPPQTSQPASQSACLSARCPPPARPEQAGAPTAPSSCLPPPSPSLPSAQPVPNPSGTV